LEIFVNDAKNAIKSPWVLAAATLMMFAALPAEATDLRCRFGDDDRENVTVLGLTADQRLVRFKECKPEKLRTIGSVSGLVAPDTALVGIDFRVQDGKLYGVGNAGGVYTLATHNAKAVKVSQLTVALDGTLFGVDFNPAADRLRVVSDTGQNLRHNVNAGGVTLVDGTLSYTAGTPATGITGAAYVNNDLDPNTGTTLFDIDTTLDQVALQSPPNAGSLVATGKLTIDADTPVGFDIYTTLRNGAAVDNSAYASLVVGGVTGFYRVNVLTGKASLIDTFPDRVVDIAIPLDQ
jgi:Domain of unknown function (DUF4394)